ncbi:hypothetical protein KUTeg_010469 [Tegillarca granosa]|uniref:Solute carrier family 13 member 2 n=1 Tax=Tegillarca granosa TaxID=220873 RepID=A0ABQ9F911_TEGGR|nr:hypothetical protein KUTeg_010469 [Tegillarca granosa]
MLERLIERLRKVDWSKVIWNLKNLWAIRTPIIVTLAFILPLSLAADGDVKFKCAYTLVVMAILWLTEALPIPVTALFPIFMFPLLGVQSAKVVCSNYVNETTMLFIGGLIVAVAVEEVNLHRRIALGIVKLIGTQPNMLMLGLMLPTWFLSMWISNTAATSMMIPIIMAVTSSVENVDQDAQVKVRFEFMLLSQISVKAMSESDNGVSGDDNPAFEMSDSGSMATVSMSTSASNAPLHQQSENRRNVAAAKSEELIRMGRGFALCVAYGANIGGIATLTGTPPNLILQGTANKIFRQKQPGSESGITFANWMGFAFPLSLITLFVAWMWLQLFFLDCSCRKNQDQTRRKESQLIIDKKYKELGPVSFGEVVVIVVFILLAILWIFRDIPGAGGWRYLFLETAQEGVYPRDSTPSILIAVSLFFLPIKLPNIFCLNIPNDDGSRDTLVYTTILSWDKTVIKLPWGVIILLGGGFALADASGSSGLSAWVGQQLIVFKQLDPWFHKFCTLLDCFPSNGSNK